MSAENFQSPLCILLHQKYCMEPVCINPEGQMQIKTSEILSETMQNININYISIIFFSVSITLLVRSKNLKFIWFSLIRISLLCFGLQGSGSPIQDRNIALEKKVFLAPSRIKFWALLSISFRVIPLTMDTTEIPSYWTTPTTLWTTLSPPWFFPAGCLLGWVGSWPRPGKSPFCLGEGLFWENLLLKKLFTGL